jgi:hypothetical protein
MRMINNLLSLRPAAMRRASLGLALFAGAAAIALGPSAAQAQFWGGYDSGWGGAPRPWDGPRYGAGPRFEDEDVLRPGEIADLLRGRGWSILSPPSMSGRHYVVNVRNGFGQRLFVVLDAYDGRILDARQMEERPNTNELAAIPGGYPATNRPDEVIRPTPAPATPSPRPYRPPTEAKRAVKSSPLEPPKEKSGTLAVAHPAVAPPAARHVVPAPAAPEATEKSSPPASTATSPAPSPALSTAPTVRQVYPASGQGAAEPAPKSAEAAPAAPAPPAPAKPAPAAPAKPVLPADAGFE